MWCELLSGVIFTAMSRVVQCEQQSDDKTSLVIQWYPRFSLEVRKHKDKELNYNFWIFEPSGTGILMTRWTILNRLVSPTTASDALCLLSWLRTFFWNIHLFMETLCTVYFVYCRLQTNPQKYILSWKPTDPEAWKYRLTVVGAVILWPLCFYFSVMDTFLLLYFQVHANTWEQSMQLEQTMN